MLTLRQRILAITGIMAAIIVLIVFLILSTRRQPADQQTDATQPSLNTANTTQPVDTTENTNNTTAQNAPTPTQVDTIPQDERYAMQLARIFTERFGTYSNQNGNDHLTDVEDMMTNSMRQWAMSQDIEQSAAYKGVTTEVFNSQIKSHVGNTIVVEIGAQQYNSTMVNGALSEETIQRTGRVELIQVDNDWKVNGLYWD